MAQPLPTYPRGGSVPRPPVQHIETSWVAAGFKLGIGFFLAGLVVSLVPIVILVVVILSSVAAATHH